MTALLHKSLSKLTDEELEALSSDDDDSDDEAVRNVCGHAKSKNLVEEYSGFEEGFNEDDPIARQMQSVLAIKASLGIDNDKEFLAEHERNKLEREKAEQERNRIANMSIDDRIRHEQQQASNLFTNIARTVVKQKEITWEQPEWAISRTLRQTPAGETVKNGGDLQAPITQLPHIRPGDPLPSTEVDESSVVEDEVVEEAKDETAPRPSQLPVKQKKISWEKPAWATQTKLRTTEAGQKVKSGGDLQAPITFAPQLHKEKERCGDSATVEAGEKKEYTWEKPEWAKHSILKSSTGGEQQKKSGKHVHVVVSAEPTGVSDIVRLASRKQTKSTAKNEPSNDPARAESLEEDPASTSSGVKDYTTWLKKERSKRSLMSETTEKDVETESSSLRKSRSRRNLMATSKSKSKRSILAEIPDTESSAPASPKVQKTASRRNLMATSKSKSKRSVLMEPTENESVTLDSSPKVQTTASRRNLMGASKSKSKRSVISETPGEEEATVNSLMVNSNDSAVLKKSNAEGTSRTENSTESADKPTKASSNLTKTKSKRNLLNESAEPAKSLEKSKSKRKIMLSSTEEETSNPPILAKSKSKRSVTSVSTPDDTSSSSSPKLSKSKSKRNLNHSMTTEESAAPCMLTKSKSKRNLNTSIVSTNEETVDRPQFSKSMSKRNVALSMTEKESVDSPKETLKKTQSRRQLLAQTGETTTDGVAVKGLEKSKSKRDLLGTPGEKVSKSMQKTKSRRNLMLHAKEDVNKSKDEKASKVLPKSKSRRNVMIESSELETAATVTEEVINLLGIDESIPSKSLRKSKSKRNVMLLPDKEAVTSVTDEVINLLQADLEETELGPSDKNKATTSETEVTEFLRKSLKKSKSKRTMSAPSDDNDGQ